MQNTELMQSSLSSYTEFCVQKLLGLFSSMEHYNGQVPDETYGENSGSRWKIHGVLTGSLLYHLGPGVN